MSNDPREALSAFLDGEDVPVVELTNALSLPDSREMLVDFVLLRAGIRADDSRPAPPFQERIERTLEPKYALFGRFFTPAPVMAVLGMAAVLLLVFWFGRSDPEPGASMEQTPPSVNRVLPFERGVDWHG